MKMVVNADGIKALIAHDPEGTLELAKEAAAQVAHALAGKITEQKVNARIENVVNGLVQDGNRWTSAISTTARDLIIKEVRDRVGKEFESKDGIAYRSEIQKQVREYLVYEEQKVVSGLQGKIDALIMQRFGALFGQKGE